MIEQKKIKRLFLPFSLILFSMVVQSCNTNYNKDYLNLLNRLVVARNYNSFLSSAINTGTATGTSTSSSITTSTATSTGTSTSVATSTGTSTSVATSTLATPIIGNATNNGQISSGFLIGTAVSGISQVQISIDSGAFISATGTTTWKYQLPNGAAMWKDNSSHTITIRGIDSSGLLTSSNTINVVKSRNRDFNGDGYSDTVGTGVFYSTNTGRAYIFNGSSAGITSTSASSPSNTITGAGTNNTFGDSATVCDINGDGYSDLVVGASSATTNTGKVYIFHGSSSGITVTLASSANKIITGPSTNSYHGYAMDCGDINGDGYADLVTTAYGAVSNKGQVYIFHSSGGTGITATTTAGAYNTITGLNAGDQFGNYVAVGDFQKDGFMDLAASTTVVNASTGVVAIFHSISSTGITVTLPSSANININGDNTNAPGGGFGYWMWTGDFNGDGYSDLISTANFSNSSAGRAYLFISSGTSSGITIGNAVSASLTVTGEFPSDRLGDTATLTDLDNDGYAEFVIGAGRYVSGGSNGRIYIYPGSATNPGGVTIGASTISKKITGSVGGRFGAAIQFADINGDGYLDLITSANVATVVSANDGKGYIFVNNKAAGSYFSQSADTTADTIINGESSIGTRFGYNFAN